MRGPQTTLARPLVTVVESSSPLSTAGCLAGIESRETH